MDVKWIIIAIFVVLGFTLLKLEHHTRKIKVVILALLAAVLYFSLMGLLNSTEFSFSNPRGIVNAVYNYFGWIGRTGSEIFDIGKNTVSLVGNAVKLNATAVR